ncbi:1487_t:CDS:1, partial [Racocetra persica]
ESKGHNKCTEHFENIDHKAKYFNQEINYMKNCFGCVINMIKCLEERVQNLETRNSHQIVDTSVQLDSFDPNNPDEFIDMLLGIDERIQNL